MAAAEPALTGTIGGTIQGPSTGGGGDGLNTLDEPVSVTIVRSPLSHLAQQPLFFFFFRSVLLLNRR